MKEEFKYNTAESGTAIQDVLAELNDLLEQTDKAFGALARHYGIEEADEVNKTTKNALTGIQGDISYIADVYRGRRDLRDRSYQDPDEGFPKTVLGVEDP